MLRPFGAKLRLRVGRSQASLGMADRQVALVGRRWGQPVGALATSISDGGDCAADPLAASSRPA